MSKILLRHQEIHSTLMLQNHFKCNSLLTADVTDNDQVCHIITTIPNICRLKAINI